MRQMQIPAACFQRSFGQPVTTAAQQQLHGFRFGPGEVAHILQSVSNRCGDLCNLLTGDVPGDMFQLRIGNLIAITADNVCQPI